MQVLCGEVLRTVVRERVQGQLRAHLGFNSDHCLDVWFQASFLISLARFPHLIMGTVVELILQGCSDWKCMGCKYKLWRRYYDSLYTLAIKSDFNFLNSEWQLVVLMLWQIQYLRISLNTITFRSPFIF